MIIAREKKKNNISEYILYMWQIEDVIRSHYFDIQAIQASVINQFDVPLPVRMEMKQWYEGLISSMKSEGIEEKGHLKSVQYYLEELETLHHKLLTVLQDRKYQELHAKAKRNMDEVIRKSAGTVSKEIEACLIALYGWLMLKLRSQEVSEETKTAMKTFSNLLAYLSKQYQIEQEGKLNLSDERNN